MRRRIYRRVSQYRVARNLRWPRLRRIRRGDVVVTITDERKRTMDFSDPYINAGQVLIVRTDSSGVGTG